jgi:hypothetical protein
MKETLWPILIEDTLSLGKTGREHETTLDSVAFRGDV